MYAFFPIEEVERLPNQQKKKVLQFFTCLLQGLERVIISKSMPKYIHEKIEKLALELVKLENEQFSLLALQLLVTCMYIGTPKKDKFHLYLFCINYLLSLLFLPNRVKRAVRKY